MESNENNTYLHLLQSLTYIPVTVTLLLVKKILVKDGDDLLMSLGWYLPRYFIMSPNS